ncbi:hypothetical protein [Flavobacterium sp. PL002]|uniref:hypothetical protein n=1 Tax=Flavobacterium sp. PL002 TaxID=1897058 RepID=UPI0017889E25|nr:hypothetical protein [Flavobacterium sp. PL002]MBE0392165.1 hypothetical protein [Flavobacterium sp. PL002]
MKKINTFWNWFQDNNQRIKNSCNESPEKQKEILFWLGKNLSYYCREIDFIIVFPKKENSKTEFIVTANGSSNYFQQVTLLIDNAPRLRTWKFTAFLIPTEKINKIIEQLEKPYIIPEITLKAREHKFITLDQVTATQKFEIRIYLKNYNLLCNTKTLDQAIFIIKQDLLVEQTVLQNISFIQLPEHNVNLIHLYEFNWYLEII